jgi:hypothetical protein
VTDTSTAPFTSRPACPTPAGKRTLRLVRILGTLCADGPLQLDDSATPQCVACAAGPDGLHPTRAQSCATTPNVVTIGEVFDRARHAGFGVVIALLALVSIPLVGLTLPIAVAVATIGVQMSLGFPRPWLPRCVRRRTLSRARLQNVNAQVARWSRGLQRVVRPRLRWLTRGPCWTLCGIGVAIQGVALALPVPGADWIFVVPLVLYGIGLLESDGLLIAVCHALTLTEVVLAVVLSEVIARGFADVFGWCARLLG